MAARRGKRIAANRAKLAKSRQRKEEEKKLGPKVWVPPRLRVDKTYVNQTVCKLIKNKINFLFSFQFHFN